MGRGSQQGAKRAVSSGVPRSGSPVSGAPFSSRSEKESALSLVKQLSQPHQDQDQTHQEPEQVESISIDPLYYLHIHTTFRNLLKINTMKMPFPGSHAQLLMNWLITETLKFVVCLFLLLYCDNTLLVLQEALACVEEMESPNLMNVFVRECIFHALEKPEMTRTVTGELLHHLLINKILSQDQVSDG